MKHKWSYRDHGEVARYHRIGSLATLARVFRSVDKNNPKGRYVVTVYGAMSADELTVRAVDMTTGQALANAILKCREHRLGVVKD